MTLLMLQRNDNVLALAAQHISLLESSDLHRVQKPCSRGDTGLVAGRQLRRCCVADLEGYATEARRLKGGRFWGNPGGGA